MQEEHKIILVLLYLCELLFAGFIYDMLDWWDKYRHRYVYVALVFSPIVFLWLLIYYPSLHIYNKFYKIKW